MSRSIDEIERPDGIAFSYKIPSDPTDKELQFVRQLGISKVYTWLEDDQANYAYISELSDRLATHGLELSNAGTLRLSKSASIHLAYPDRDKIIDEFKEFISDLKRAGVHTTTFTWEPDCVQSTENMKGRGDSITRAVELEALKKQPPTREGNYSHEQIWDNFAYFMREIMPVAESVGIRLSLHPNDPPMPDINGVPCLIYNRQCYDRAFEIADSDWLGMEFCCGCWLEGGDQFGNILEDIEKYVSAGKVFIVHFRNVSSPLPNFEESFLDDGYMNMHTVMETFINAGFRGNMTLDHSPSMAYPMAEKAYAIGYMNALRQSLSKG